MKSAVKLKIQIRNDIEAQGKSILQLNKENVILKTRNEDRMSEDNLPANLLKRIEELRGKEQSYWDDEMYSPEALSNRKYREELERSFNLDPLGPLPPRL
ncbi:MAG TPA: hypothetical protein V6C97_13435 [Oculatellaceae cyanobacterium]